MQLTEALKPAAVLVSIVILVVAGTGFAGLAFSSGSSPPDSETIRGQSPDQFQPANVNPDTDSEAGQITLGGVNESKQILIDTSHDNQFDRMRIQPVIRALTEQGHTVRYSDNLKQPTASDSEMSTFAESVSDFDAIIIFYPTEGFTQNEIDQLRSFTTTGGRVLLFAGPSEASVSTGLLGSSVSSVRFEGNELLRQYGVQIDGDLLYNTNESRTDNNYKSIYAEPIGSGPLTRNVSTVNLDSSGSVIVSDTNQAEPLLRAAAETKRFSTRRSGQYITAAQAGNLVVVSDTTLVTDTDVYDVDNEQFVGNLLTFVTSGNKADFSQLSNTTSGSG